LSSYRLSHHGDRFFASTLDDALPSLVIQSGGQECLVRKTGNSNMTQSEESITLMTSYRLPCHDR
ncbi:MAG: hypothetical protein ACLRP4_08300, partial [Dialister invisus]